MTEYAGIIVTGIIEGAPDGRNDFSGRELVSVDVGMVNFSPGTVGVPGDCTPYPVIKGVQDGWDDGFTGRETVGEVILIVEGVQDGWDDGLTGREPVGEVESLMRGFPESVFGKRTSGYIIDESGTLLSLPMGAIVTLVSDPSSFENNKAANVGTNDFYETFMEGGYDKWYLIVETGDGKYNIYEKDPADPPIDGDSIPDTRNLGFIKVEFEFKSEVIQFGRYVGGLS